MFYEKNNSRVLTDALFKNPTSEYRGAPFWAWNDKLEKDKLLWQIDQFRRMGLGGFHMHVRSGMATPYLSPEFMELIKACVEKARHNGMKAYLYDEDRWPSGAAGGMVTVNHEYRQRQIIMSVNPEKFGLAVHDDGTVACDGENVTSYLHPEIIACYDVEIDGGGYLARYKRILPAEAASGVKWYAIAVTMGDSGWYNGQAYVDTMNKDAMKKFIDVTYETYYKAVGDDFGGVVPSIFTDEPQVGRSYTPGFAAATQDVVNPWTPAFPEEFRKRYGMEIADVFPEVIWDRKAAPATVRYYFHDLICELFTQAFSDQCGEWCSRHGLALTGHMMHEPTLRSQTECIGEAMRAYRGFQIPGIDMLCDAVELTTAKQCQSAVNQYGREAMISELYGVTGWGFDFRGHKFQGDWQAALGVTVRVQHLSWYSMKGSAKRDYPASISYQSEWYKNYSLIEDHFARVNTALTRGVPDVKVAVIHPIESYWMAYGPNDTGADNRERLQSDFDNVINWLLFGTIDFDYICESLLPELYGGSDGAKLAVGKMKYSAVVVAGVDTLRLSTVKILEEFIGSGGKVVFLGAKPRYVDALPSDKADALYDKAIKPQFNAPGLLGALESERDVEIRMGDGARASEYIYRKRVDGERQWLFIARAKKAAMNARDEGHNNASQLFITVKGRKTPYVYDTVTGKIYPADYRHKNGKTEIRHTFYRYDSLLLRLDDAKDRREEYCGVSAPAQPSAVLDFKTPLDYKLGEPNVLVLDMPEWSEDGENYQPAEEMLRIDLKLREKYGYPKADGIDVQPWVIGEVRPEKSVYLKFVIRSETAPVVKLAYEEAESVMLNGVKVPVTKDGYFTDAHIFTMPLGKLKKGENQLVVKAPLGKRTSLENMFLLGQFGVKVCGAQAFITAKPKKLAFGDITTQGLPFYGADVTYKVPFECGDCDLNVNTTLFGAAVVTAKLDGKEIPAFAFPPYRTEVKGVKAGRHVMTFTAHLTRVNTFGTLHTCKEVAWKGPGAWYDKGHDWAYEYQLKESGILKSPLIEIYEKG